MIGTDIAKAAEILRQGGLVAIPTETVYGLAANALDVKAVSRVFEAKNRPFFDPLICHFPSLDRIKGLIPELGYVEEHLFRQFSPGPLTLLLPRPNTVPELVTSGSPQVAVRAPAHPIALELLDQLDFPLAAPSANPFGYISPTRAEHVESQLGNRIDYILDGGPCQVGVESSVVEITALEGRVLRPGGITIEMLQHAVPELAWKEFASISGTSSSPGQLMSHYAPRKPLTLVDVEGQLSHHAPGLSFFIGFDTLSGLPYAKQFLLSENGDLAEAASRLFEALHLADEAEQRNIVVLTLPEVGLGRAINDRLRRAAAKRP